MARTIVEELNDIARLRAGTEGKGIQRQAHVGTREFLDMMGTRR